MEGFIRRVWGKLGIDKIFLIIKEIFIVRFYKFESKEKVLSEGMFMFDKKICDYLIMVCRFGCEKD